MHLFVYHYIKTLFCLVEPKTSGFFSDFPFDLSTVKITLCRTNLHEYLMFSQLMINKHKQVLCSSCLAIHNNCHLLVPTWVNLSDNIVGTHLEVSFVSRQSL